MDNGSNKKKKLILNALIIVVLVIALCITTFALLYSMVKVDDNSFMTGSIKVNLNDGKPVIEEDDLLFEPGMTVQRKFFIENEGTWDVYYKIYFEDIKGELADVLDITIKDGERTVYSGKVSDMTKDKVDSDEEILRDGERRQMTVTFSFPKDSGNEVQNAYLKFNMSVDAVQTKNNPQRMFD